MTNDKSPGCNPIRCICHFVRIGLFLDMAFGGVIRKGFPWWQTMRKGRVSALGIILCFFPASSLWAQKDAGTITGTVRDATGAVVPGVAITVTHVQTNISFTTVTGATGTYTVPALRVGEYVVTAESTGFKKEVRRGVVLQVNQVAVVDLTLDVGEVSDT